MNHLIITIDLPVDERLGKLTDAEAQEAAHKAYLATRASLVHFTRYNPEDDVNVQIQQ